MPGYMRMPQFKLLLDNGTYSFINRKGMSIKTVHVENAFPVATVVVSDPQARNRAKFCKGMPIDIYVKEAFETSWFHLLRGKVRFATEGLGKNGETIVLKADGQGYGLSEMLVNQEYGAQSENSSLDRLDDIINDLTLGIVPKYVNEILNSGDPSGYSFTTASMDSFTDSIPYMYFPFKPATKCLNDLIDIQQALAGASAGAHWLVTTDYELLLTTVGSHSSYAANKGWTTFINGQAAAGPLSTLIQKRDFIDFNFEDLEEEVNYILYYANCIHPVNKDRWTNGNASAWDNYPDGAGEFAIVDDDVTAFMVGTASIQTIWHWPNAPYYFWYPDTVDLGLDVTALGGKYSIPTLNFWLRRNALMKTSPGLGVYIVKALDFLGPDPITGFWCPFALPSTADAWKYYSIPIGPYWSYAKSNAFVDSWTAGWADVDAPGDWTDVNAIMFGGMEASADGGEVRIDGLYLDGWVLRAAYNSTKIAANDCKMRIVNDPFAKYDTLKAIDDSGTAALLAKAELLRGQTTPMICSFKTGMMRNAWPGQLFHAHARANQAGVFQIDRNFRINQITHEISTEYNSSVFAGTDDIINSMSRAAFDSHNEVMKSYRPEFQDRQSSGTKLRDLDITAAILAVDYG
jgi:hypothetical protein